MHDVPTSTCGPEMPLAHARVSEFFVEITDGQTEMQGKLSIFCLIRSMPPISMTPKGLVAYIEQGEEPNLISCWGTIWASLSPIIIPILVILSPPLYKNLSASWYPRSMKTCVTRDKPGKINFVRISGTQMKLIGFSF